MRGFHANNCRLCPKVFCCKKCRLKHETNVHKVFPDCDICVNGKLFLKNCDNNFLQHLESAHLPVHCVNCKKVFNSIEDLLQHKKCNFCQSKEVSPKTPFRGPPAILISADDNDSPILQESQRQDYLNCILVTSTPMQRGEEPNLMFEKSKEVITPVDKPSRVINKSIIKKTDSAKSDTELSKRRVTFGETPSNPADKNMGGSGIDDPKIISDNNPESLDGYQKSNDVITPVTGMSTNQFYSAKTDVSSKSVRENNNINNCSEGCTPVTRMSTNPFYSAKTDADSAKTDISSKPVRENNNININNFSEGFTPVGIPNMSKLVNVKGDIYKKQDLQRSNSSESKNFNAEASIKNQVNMNEMSMELCTSGRTIDPSGNDPNITKDISKESVHNDTSVLRENAQVHKEYIPDLCTPAKTPDPGNIVLKGDIFRKTKQESISAITKTTKENEDDSKTDTHNTCDALETKEFSNTETSGHDTLWLSAVNSEESIHFGQQSNENKRSDKENYPTLEENDSLDAPESPPRTNQKRVSIVMPTPILKTTNVQMKFHFPAHLSSTPIMSTGTVKVKQTKIINDISTRVIQQHTPYKTPQGELCEFVQRKIVSGTLCRDFRTIPENEAGPSEYQKFIHLENIKENYSSSDTALCRDVVHDPTHEHYEDTYSSVSSREPEAGISVSSMTESSLWSSMTRIVKSVLGGFTNMSQDSSMSIKNVSSAFKRQLSDSDSGDFLEAPRLKRFKFTDIKCRRTIRDLPALELTRNLPAPTSSLGRIEIVKSVSTVYGGQTMRIQCDKATQTDDYLLYGWHPHA